MPSKNDMSSDDILDQIVEGYFEVDLAGHFSRVNAALSRISGYAVDELAGMNNRRYTTPKTARALYAAFNQVYRSGNPAEMITCEIICKDLTRRMLELSVSLMRTAQGEPSGFRGIARDITSRWEAEQYAETFRCRREQIILHDALFDMTGRLSGNFQTLCNEINNIVARILEDIDPQHSSKFSAFEQYTRIKNIERIATQGKALLRRLTGLAEVETGAAVHTDLDEIVRISAETVCRDREDIEIHEQHGRDPWPVQFDRVTMGQALLAVCANSAEAMSAGGRLFLRTQNMDLDLATAAPLALEAGRYVQANITDTGIGMAPQTVEQALTPFFTTKEKQAGLGLTAAYGIVRKHGGILALFSEKGVGTTVSIYLPIASEPPADISA
ncbi:MAG: PAS domain S-box protein [Desulfobacterales bacterium]|nr:PAS domain S-box protein [Desulfobacterales bacterium]